MLSYISLDLLETLESILIYENKNHFIESFRKTKNCIKVTKSGRNTIMSTFKIKWNKHKKNNNIEMFHLKMKKKAQEKFRILHQHTELCTQQFKKI